MTARFPTQAKDLRQLPSPIWGIRNVFHSVAAEMGARPAAAAVHDRVCAVIEPDRGRMTLEVSPAGPHESLPCIPVAPVSRRDFADRSQQSSVSSASPATSLAENRELDVRMVNYG